MQVLKNEWTIRYQPHHAQEQFHLDRYKHFFRAIFAGTGSGKTIAGLFECLSWLLDNPGIVGYVFEPTYPMVRRILLPTLENDIMLGKPLQANPAIKRFSRVDNRIDFRNGSVLWFGSLEDPEKAEGPNIDFIHVDEARLIRHFDVAWRVIQRRLRGSVPNRYPCGAWVTTTPDAPGSELHRFFEHPKTRNPRSSIYRWSIDNNPFLPAEYVEGIKRSHHGGLAERFVYGRFAAVGAGTIPFDYASHVIQESAFNKNAIVEWVYGIDFGWTNPSCILAIGFDNDARAYIADEYYEARVTQDRVLTEAKAMMQRFGHGKVFCDPTQLQTIKWLVDNGLDAEKSEPKRDEGIRHMAGYFPKAGDGKPRIQILSRCVNLIAELQVYDESKKEFDHACFIAGTPIQTIDGRVPIEHVCVGDLAETPEGYFPVIAHGLTDKNAQVFTVTFSDGRQLTGTGNHPIYVDGKGFVPLDTLRYGYIVTDINSLICHKLKSGRAHCDEAGTETTDVNLHGDGAISVISVKKHIKRRPVYNLSVSPIHEYYANGILVHNCDALRYGLGCKMRKEGDIDAWILGP